MMKSSRKAFAGWRLVSVLWSVVCLAAGLGQPAFAQTAQQSPPPRQLDDKKASAQEQRERGIARCRENRGVDCDTPEGQKEWVNQERPITDAERTSAAASRRAGASSSKRY